MGGQLREQSANFFSAEVQCSWNGTHLIQPVEYQTTSRLFSDFCGKRV